MNNLVRTILEKELVEDVTMAQYKDLCPAYWDETEGSRLRRAWYKKLYFDKYNTKDIPMELGTIDKDIVKEVIKNFPSTTYQVVFALLKDKYSDGYIQLLACEIDGVDYFEPYKDYIDLLGEVMCTTQHWD